MTIVGGSTHRKQITFDYVDDDGSVHCGRIRPATRHTRRRLAEHCPDRDDEFALDGCTKWRSISEEYNQGIHS